MYCDEEIETDGDVIFRVVANAVDTEAVGVRCFVIAAVACVIFNCASLIILS